MGPNFSQFSLVRSQINKLCHDNCWGKEGALLQISPIGLQHMNSIRVLIADMQIGCHPRFTHNQAINADQIKNCIPSGDIDMIASDASSWFFEPNLPSILLCLLFYHDRDTHVPTKSIFEAQRIRIGSSDVTMKGAPIKQGICWTNAIIGGWNRIVKMQQLRMR